MNQQQAARRRNAARARRAVKHYLAAVEAIDVTEHLGSEGDWTNALGWLAEAVDALDDLRSEAIERAPAELLFPV